MNLKTIALVTNTALPLLACLSLLPCVHAQEGDTKSRKESKDIQAELTTTQQARKGSSALTVRTLALSGDILSTARLELELPFGVSRSGMKQNPTVGLSWSLQDSATQSLTFHPQYDFGNPALTARRRLKSSAQNLILPLEAEFGDEERGRFSASLGAILARGATTGLYSIGLERRLNRGLKLGTELEGSGGQDLAHLSGDLGLTEKLHLALDYALPVRRVRPGDTKSLLSAGMSFTF